MKKSVKNHTIGLVSEEQELTAKERSDKRTLKEYFSYDILLDPFYCAKLSYIPGHVPGRLGLITIPEFEERDEENHTFRRATTRGRRGTFF